MPQERFVYLGVTIANGAALSGAVNLTGHLLVGVIMPSAWSAANLTFQVSRDGVIYNDVYDSAGNEKTVNAAASRHVMVDPITMAGAEYLKVRSGTTGAPVNQGGDRALVLVLRPAQ